jgi:hypothetical protein
LFLYILPWWWCSRLCSVSSVVGWLLSPWPWMFV